LLGRGSDTDNEADDKVAAWTLRYWKANMMTAKIAIIHKRFLLNE